MEFDWINELENLSGVTAKEVEETFEDPFSIRLLPDTDDVPANEARYFILGKSISGRGIFTVFWTDGKRYRVILARPMTEAENAFFERKTADLIN
jgi:uncharacterized protein